MNQYHWLDDFGDVFKITNYPPPDCYKYFVVKQKKLRHNTKHQVKQMLEEIGEALF